MSDNSEIQPGVRIDKGVWEGFRQDVKDRHGVVRGNLRREVETALRQYTESANGGNSNDRLRRIENKLDELAEGGAPPSDDSERKKNNDSGFSSTTKNRLEKIEARIEREAGDAEKVHESVVNNAIEDIAGSSRPTLERYHEMLEQRRIAMKWPIEDSKLWWLDERKFVNVLGRNFNERYWEFKHEYGEEWWESVYDENYYEEEVERGVE